MKVKQLILSNFKSYAGIHYIGPFDGFTSVIGTNASGKSNCFDSICFVLGAPSNVLRCKDLSELIYKGEEQMNTTFVQIILNSEFKGEFSFKRTIVGKGSCYYVNDAKKSAGEYKEILNSLGFHSNYQSYILFQGDIGYIASMKPKDLTKLIENLSGSSQYCEEYDDLESKVNEALKSSKNAYDQMNQISKIYQERKEEVAISRKYRELESKIKEDHDKLTNYILCQNAFQMKDRQKDMNVLVLKSREIKTQINDLSIAACGMEEVIKTAKNILKEAEASNRENIRFLERIQHKTNLIETKSDETIRIKNKFIEEKKSLEKVIKDENKEIKNLQNSIKKFGRCNTKIINNKADISEVINSIMNNSLSVNSLSKKQEYENSQMKLALIECEFNQAERKLEISKNRLASLKVPPPVSQPPTCVDDKKSEEEKLRNILLDKQELLRSSCIRCSSNNRLNEMHNLVKKLQSSIAGVYGCVRDICRPIRTKYENAILSGIGYHADEIVVSEFSTACQCISLCKQFNLGRATFLPLDKICRDEKKIVGELSPLSDYIECDSIFDSVIKYCCKDIYLCEDNNLVDDIYSKMIYRRIITIQGTLYQSNGLITGGQLSNSFGTFMIPEKIEEEIKVVENNIKILKDNVSESLTMYQKMRKIHENDVKNHKKYNEELIKIQDEVEHMKKVYEEKLTLKNNASLDCENLLCEFELNKERESISNSKHYDEMQQVHTDLIKKLGITCIQDLIKIFESFTKEEQKNFENHSKLAYLENSTSREKLSSVNSEIDNSVAKYSEIQLEKENLIKQHKEWDSKLVSTQEAVESAKSKVFQAINKRKELMSKLSKNKKMECETEEQIFFIEKSISLTKTKLEEVIPQSSFSSIDEVMESEFNSLPSELKTLQTQKVRDSMVKKIQHSIEEQEDKIKEIIPNFGAEGEAITLKEKKKNAGNLVRQLQAEHKKINDNFISVKRKRKDCFNKALTITRNALSEIYPQLTSSKTQPLGGHGFLCPEKEELPFLGGIIYSVIPPHKKERSLETLSGGEQTLAIVALAFSLSRIAPAPIFILDEIDSALDSRNVDKLAEFLSSQTSKQQIIIISHKSSVYGLSDTLIGVTRKNDNKSYAYRYMLNDIAFDDIDSEPNQLRIAGDN